MCVIGHSVKSLILQYVNAHSGERRYACHFWNIGFGLQTILTALNEHIVVSELILVMNVRRPSVVGAVLYDMYLYTMVSALKPLQFLFTALI
jgi:hypothetical protein